MILVTGGAGYIGSHVVKDLADRGYSVIVIDNLSTGHLKAVDQRAIFIHGDVRDSKNLDNIFSSFPIEAVMHFAANCLVGESVRSPLKYYQNNVETSLTLIQKMIDFHINKFIFSSTCATYGVPNCTFIHETLPANPINPYGKSKLFVESILQDVSKSDPFHSVSLRYFNAAGCNEKGVLGEDHKPETHLIPNVLNHLQGKTKCIEVFGNDYDTPDGTCIRDYIHVSDISLAHILALESLLKCSNHSLTEVFNVGNTRGFSVLEIIHKCEEVTGLKATIKISPRRQGDPPHLVASSKKIQEFLGWMPRFSIEEMIQTAWNWKYKNPDGY
ncbi:MAG: UDP-glucose 4-epimerase GalE [Bacillota bacterium]|nr:UDP-glucose 4-epimerase GalE [Bacillota bacterium]